MNTIKEQLPVILAIGRATFREIIRERLLYGIFLAAALLTSASFFLATVSLGQDSRVLQNTGLASIHFLTVFVTIFVTTTNLHRDFERRALYFLFPKPVSRSQYVLGKFLGYLFLLITTLVILGGLFSLGAAFLHPQIVPAAAINLAYSFMEIAFLIALALLFAGFTAPLNAALYTLGFFFIGHSQTSLRAFAADTGSAFAEKLVTFVYYILPNLEKFDVRKATLYEIPIPPAQVAWSIFYCILLTSIALYLASLVMRKQEL